MQLTSHIEARRYTNDHLKPGSVEPRARGTRKQQLIWSISFDAHCKRITLSALNHYGDAPITEAILSIALKFSIDFCIASSELDKLIFPLAST